MVFSPTTVTGTAVLEYGPTEILPQVGALSKHANVSADPVAKPAAHTRAESRGSGPSKVDAAERQTLCWREQDSNPRSPGRERRFRFGKRELGKGHRENKRRSRDGEYLKRDRKFESCSLQRRDGMGQAARKWHHRRCSQLMECPDAPAERLEQVPRRPGPR